MPPENLSRALPSQDPTRMHGTLGRFQGSLELPQGLLGLKLPTFKELQILSEVVKSPLDTTSNPASRTTRTPKVFLEDSNLF